MAVTAAAVRLRWSADLWLRMRRHLLLKAVGISVFMWLFFIGYFHLLRHPARPVLEMPLTLLDDWIAFQPGALAAYVSLWLYLGIAPGLLLRLRELIAYALWVGGLCAAGLLCFYLVPTAVPPMALDVGDYPGFSLLRGVDAAGNACPSLHVASAMFTVLWLHHLLHEVRAPALLRAVNIAWFGLIAYSTLAIKQHVVLDVLAGAALGAAFAWPALHWRPADAPMAAALIGRHRLT